VKCHARFVCPGCVIEEAIESTREADRTLADEVLLGGQVILEQLPIAG
jgi:hypothetical protein